MVVSTNGAGVSPIVKKQQIKGNFVNKTYS